MDPTAAQQALWPQLLRYAITAAGVWLASRGYANAADVELIGGGLLALAPPAYRVVTTMLARLRAKG